VTTPRALRVCYVMPVADRLGGAEKMLWLLLRYGDRTRIDPSVVFLTDGPFLADCEDMGVPATLINTGRLRDVRRSLETVTRLTLHFRRCRPDLIMEWFGKSHPWVAPAAAFAGVGSRVAWWQHSVVERHDLLARLIAVLPARAVGAESIAAAEAQESLWPHRPTFVVHSGVEDERPSDHHELRRRARSELGIADDEVLVGMIARVQRWKGQHHMLQALAVLRDESRACRGLLVGGDAHGLDPEYNVEVRDLRAGLGLEDAVIWHDQTRDPRPYLYALDVFVNASVRENLSLALLEAMAAERCIVAVADGGTPEVITDGESGVLVARSDTLLLTDALRRVVGDATLRSRLGAAARAEYERRFTALGWAQAVEDRIEALCSPNHRPRIAAVARRTR
jgi:glycosyltransferase involved in cell wall biosynthesis